MPLVLIMVIFYFLVLRPQQKKEKDRKAQIAAIQKGDDVLTIGGIYGKVVQVDDNSILLQVDTNTRLRVDKQAIQSVPSKEEPAKK